MTRLSFATAMVCTICHERKRRVRLLADTSISHVTGRVRALADAVYCPACDLLDVPSGLLPPSGAGP